MKRTLLTLMVALATSFATINAQNVNIPSTNFKACLLGNNAINTNMDSEIQISEAQAFTGTINCSNTNIGDLTGIEEFTSLTGLVCYSAFITNIDLSSNLALTSLNCQNNFLTNIDLSSNTALTYIACGLNNSLTSLNIANGNNTNITNLAVANTPNLTCIQIDDADTTGYGWSGASFEFDNGVMFSNNCGLTTGISETASENKMNIYPNPTTGQVHFSAPTNVQLTSVTGQVIADRKNVNMLDLTNQPAGIYFVILTDNNGQVLQRNKIMKE